MSPEFKRYRSSDPTDPWFRIGSVFINTTSVVTAVLVVSMFAVSLTGGIHGSIGVLLSLRPGLVFSGYAWQVVTWPLVNQVGFFALLGLFFFWYFGTETEKEIGRFKMLRFLLWTTFWLSVLALLLSFVFPGDPIPGIPWLFGIDKIQLMILLIFIAERPTAQFFFGIPGWVIAAIFLVLALFGALAGGLPWVLHLILGLGIGALVAKSQGLLSLYDQVPTLNLRRGGPRKKRTARGAAKGAVTQGPWAGSAAAPVDPRKAAVQSRLDQLLDKISAGGIDSLTDKERAELSRLRDQLRGG